jgi:hypothetical protein
MNISNGAREKLIGLVARFGPDICSDPKRCEALLRDVCGNQFTRELNALLAAVKEHAASDLAAEDGSVPLEVLLARLSSRLHDNLGIIEELAQWSIASWALALGKTVFDVDAMVLGTVPDRHLELSKIEFSSINISSHENMYDLEAVVEVADTAGKTQEGILVGIFCDNRMIGSSKTDTWGRALVSVKDIPLSSQEVQFQARIQGQSMMATSERFTPRRKFVELHNATGVVSNTDIGSYYKGETVNGLADGFGIAKGRDLYEGYFRVGKRDGKGKYSWSSGEVYEGFWNDDNKNGWGINTWPSGEVYDGEWAGDIKNGRGKQTFPNGQVYDGEWKDGKKNGRGIYTWPDGAVYDGEWKDDKQNGKGIYTWSDGAVYDGEEKDGKRNGRGIFTRPNGQVYDGEWAGDMRNGRGKLTWPYGQVYDGEWKDNKYNGIGKLTEIEFGTVYDGELKDGEKNGRGKQTFPNGQVYDGEWKSNMKYGRGKLTYTDGRVYDGEWKCGYENGKGKLTYLDGRVYDGEWEMGQKKSQRESTYTYGSIHYGEYGDDKTRAQKFIKLLIVFIIAIFIVNILFW